MPERDVATYLKNTVARLGGKAIKMRWEGRSHAPDYCVLMYPAGAHELIETKAPGKEARAGQVREHERLRRAGFVVRVLDTREKIDEWARGYE